MDKEKNKEKRTMSQFTISLWNATDITLGFQNAEDSGNDQQLESGQQFPCNPRFNIPDNSNSEEYFDAHHMEFDAGVVGGPPIFSFWDDDSQNYNIFYCVGVDWANTTQIMPGKMN